MVQAIEEEAEAFVRRYGTLFGSFAGLTLSDVPRSAKTVAEYYRPGVTFFANGRTTTIASQEEAVHLFAKEQQKAIIDGLGTHLVLDDFSISIYSSSSCLCNLTWTFHPPKDSKVTSQGWTFTNIYGYRSATGEVAAGFEFVLRDNEVSEMRKATGKAFDE